MVGTWEGVARWESGRGHGLDSVCLPLYPHSYSTCKVPNIPVPVYLHVRVRVVQGVRDEEQGRLTSPRANAIHMMICPSNTTLFAEGSRAAADDIPAGSIGSLAGYTGRRDGVTATLTLGRN